jgi:hypothetical protein
MDFEQYVIDALGEIKEKQELMLIQVTKTNGRVTSLEEFKIKQEVQVNELVAESNKAKGRDKILWATICIGGTVAGFLIEHWISKL